MAMSIREAEPGDIEAVLGLWRSADAVASVTDDPDGVAALLARDPGALAIAEVDGSLVGTLIIGWDGWRAGLYRLAVAPAWRRRGVARALVEHAEVRLAGLGARRIGAIVMTEHDHAVAFWHALGYERDARVDRYVKALPRP